MVKSFAGSQKGSTMGYIHCCGGLRKTRSFRLSPQDGFLLCELDYLHKCPVCNNTIIQITRIDNENKITTVRKKNKKGINLFEKLKNKILYEEKTYKITNQNKFYLYYNEFGKKKKCFSNLKNLKLGLKPYIY